MNLFPQTQVINHPLLLHKVTLLRDQKTPCDQFRRLVYEISLILFMEATRHWTCLPTMVQTPLQTCQGYLLEYKEPILIPILRAGLGMVDAFLALIPTAKIGHIGLMRNEKTLQPESYYFKIPTLVDEKTQPVILCDPMLATGGTIVHAITQLKKHGIQQITLVSIISAPEGIEYVLAHHPDLNIITASIDEQLNEQGYILPGLGDAGDRLYGTY